MPDVYNDKKNRMEGSRDPASFINSSGVNNAEAGGGSSQAKSNLLQAPSISLPKGGGSLKSIDEKFTVNSVNGTASFSIPLPFSPGRMGANPAFSLSYNSGAGNGVFGLGWSVGMPCIQRKTDKELPAYMDVEESDTFILSDAEDLVPELVQHSSGQWVRRKATSGNALITYYRPRIEGAFARIEKWNDGGNVY